MKITVEQLRELRACKEGIQDFLSIYPEGVAEIEWTLEAQLDLLKTPLKKYLGWVYFKKLGPLFSMSGADLQEADLQEADLQEADFRGADFREANLFRANLFRANLFRANLGGADLRGANLGGADLFRADLQRADLQRVEFYHEGKIYVV